MMFIFQIDNIVDIITNSSSELFIMKADGANVINELIESVLPDFRETYAEPRLLKDSDSYELWLYIYYNYTFTGSANAGWGGKKTYDVIDGFTFDEMYIPQNNFHIPEFEIRQSFITDNKERILKALDPNNTIWLMKSLDDNPDSEIFEKLLPIGRRIGAI